MLSQTSDTQIASTHERLFFEASSLIFPHISPICIEIQSVKFFPLIRPGQIPGLDIRNYGIQVRCWDFGKGDWREIHGTFQLSTLQVDYLVPSCASALVQPGGIEVENEMTLRMLDKYGWWKVRGGSWCQVDKQSSSTFAMAATEIIHLTTKSQ
jgi:hypothetical protein